MDLVALCLITTAIFCFVSVIRKFLRDYSKRRVAHACYMIVTIYRTMREVQLIHVAAPVTQDKKGLELLKGVLPLNLIIANSTEYVRTLKDFNHIGKLVGEASAKYDLMMDDTNWQGMVGSRYHQSCMKILNDIDKVLTRHKASKYVRR